MPSPIEQLLSRTLYTADGVSTVWDFSFSGGYLDPLHVKAYSENPLGVRTQITTGTLIGEFQLQIVPAVAAGDVLVIYRDTPKNIPLVDFTDASGFSEIALDTNAKQAVFIAAEVVDTVNSLTVGAAVKAAETAAINAASSEASRLLAAASLVAAQAQAASAEVSASNAGASLASTLTALAAAEAAASVAASAAASAAALAAEAAAEAKVATLRGDIAGTGGAGLIGTPSGPVSDRLNGLDVDIQKTTSLRQFWARVNGGNQDVRLLVIGDSTGNETTEWVYLLAQWLGTQVPTHTIRYGLYSTSTFWPALTVVSAGSGTRSIEIWNGSVAGSTAEDFEGGRAPAFWAGRDFDAVVINMGHNYGTTGTETSMFMEFVATAAEVRLRAPNADLLVTLQNPRTDGPLGPVQTAFAAAAWRSVANKIGCGVIDVWSRFRAHPNPASLMVDTVHPNAAGQDVWLSVVQEEFARPTQFSGAQQPAVSPLTTLGRNWLPNPRFAQWAGAVPDFWTFTNCTPSKDTSTVDGSLYSMRVTNAGSGSPSFSAAISGAMLQSLRGRRVTMVARVFKPAGLGSLAGRVSLTSNNGVASVSFTSRARNDKSVGGWTWEVAQIQVQTDATSLTVLAYPGDASGADSGERCNFAGIWVFEGDLPLAGSTDDEVNKLLSTWYNADDVKLHPTSGTGTLTVTGSTIEVTGATSPNSGVVFNLPPLIAGRTYRLSFDPISITGAPSGFIFVRNGVDGGASSILSGTWLAVDGLRTYDFTGVSTPVSVWIGSGAGATGWRVELVNVVQLP